MERPDVGETFSGKVDRISKAGNGIIELEECSVNIGPVEKEAVGEVVEVEMVKGIFGFCKTREFTPEGYKARLHKVWTPGPRKSKSRRVRKSGKVWNSASGDALPEKVKEARKYKSPVVSPREDNEVQFTVSVQFCDECGSTMTSNRNVWVCRGCTRKIEKESNLRSDGSAQESESDREEDPRADTPGPISECLGTQETGVFVPVSADGICEGCGEPAPFFSKPGEPYLHAHHIHKLNRGHSDSPDTVALCPNCHYRVHYGEDGDRYNQQLLEYTRSI